MSNSETTEKPTDDISVAMSAVEKNKPQEGTFEANGKSLLRMAKGLPKAAIATKVTGRVKRFNKRTGFGFITRNDTKEDVFFHHSSIVKVYPRKFGRFPGVGEEVEFDVVLAEKGKEAANVTGLNGEPLKRQSCHEGRSDQAKDEHEKRGEEGGEGRGSGRGKNRFRRGSTFLPRYFRGGGLSRGGQRSTSQGDGDKAQLELKKERDEAGDNGENRGRGGRGRGGRGRGGRRGGRWFSRRGRGGDHQSGGEGDVVPAEIMVP